MNHLQLGRKAASDFWTKYAQWMLYGTYLAGKLVVVVAAPMLLLLVFNRALCRRVFEALTRKNPLSGLTWALLIFVMYGLCETVYGLLEGYKPVMALEVLVFNLSPLYLFLGFWAGERRPELIRSFVKFTVWFNCIYAVLYFAFLKDLHFANPVSGSIGLIGILAFETNLARFWLPILILSFTTIANQIRADWTGLSLALIVWAVVTKNVGRMLTVAAALVVLLILGFVFDVKFPGMAGRGGELSARETIGRSLSSFDPELAREYSSNSAVYAGTVAWRETWWKAIREVVSEQPSTLIFGMGYGYPIADLVPYLKGTDLRTPHSVFYFALAYSGCVGVVLFALLQGCIFWLLWRTFRLTGQSYGMLLYGALFVEAFFGNFFEAPQSVVPIYIVVGMCIGSQFNARLTGGVIRPQGRVQQVRERMLGVRPEQVAVADVGRGAWR